MDSDLLSAFISGGAADKNGQSNAAESRENMHGIVKSPTSSSLHSTASRKLLMAGDGVSCSSLLVWKEKHTSGVTCTYQWSLYLHHH